MLELVARRGEPVRIDPIDTTVSDRAVEHESCLLEHFEVLRDGWAADR